MFSKSRQAICDKITKYLSTVSAKDWEVTEILDSLFKAFYVVGIAKDKEPFKSCYEASLAAFVEPSQGAGRQQQKPTSKFLAS